MPRTIIFKDKDTILQVLNPALLHKLIGTVSNALHERENRSAVLVIAHLCNLRNVVAS